MILNNFNNFHRQNAAKLTKIRNTRATNFPKKMAAAIEGVRLSLLSLARQRPSRISRKSAARISPVST